MTVLTTEEPKNITPPKIKTSGPLRDVVQYVENETIPETPWLSKLKLRQPRRDIHCLDWATRFGKRVADIFMALMLLILLSPVMLLTAIAVKLTSPGPIIFRQTRVGLNLRKTSERRLRINGEPPDETGERREPGRDRRKVRAYGKEFTLYKFRTMRNDAEKNGAQFATKGDPRVTSIGRFMRKTRLDELPQLWNVLRGEMTMVGPRPERPVFIEELSIEVPGYLDRLGLKPGLTGLAQIENGYDNDIESFRRKVKYDLLYLQNCSLWNDFKILLRTVRVVLSGSGAL